MKINVHAGHNPDEMVACGAIGLIKESTEARKVKDEVVRLLKIAGHTVYDCTVNNGTNQSDVLKKIVAKCNANAVDLDVSIHFNAGANDKSGNGKTTGTEVLLYSSASKSKTSAEKVANCIATLGFKNRGIKYNTKLAVINSTKAPAMLIECCFVDDKDDVTLYNYKSMAKAIAEGIHGKSINESSTNTGSSNQTSADKTVYTVQCGAFSVKTNADALAKKLKSAGFDAVVTKK